MPDVLKELIDEILEGLEDRLTQGMTKALDTVTTSMNSRLQALEEDQARILRHLGLDG
jgi:hypothetical protein